MPIAYLWFIASYVGLGSFSVVLGVTVASPCALLCQSQQSLRFEHVACLWASSVGVRFRGFRLYTHGMCMPQSAGQNMHCEKFVRQGFRVWHESSGCRVAATHRGGCAWRVRQGFRVWHESSSCRVAATHRGGCAWRAAVLSSCGFAAQGFGGQGDAVL
jgi:hypothetical protein